MSHFPDPTTYSQKQSLAHLDYLKITTTSLILKKAKGVYLYDLDQNKYADFYLDEGNIFTQHSPPRLTKFIKNALSSGLNACGLCNKFLFKAQKKWVEITSCPCIGFHSSFVEMILSTLNILHHDKKNICIGYTTDYLYELLLPLKNIVSLKKITNQEQISHIDLLLIEDTPSSLGYVPTKINNLPILKIHSRFLFRPNHPKNNIFEQEYLHYIYSSPFGGKNIGVLVSPIPIFYNPPSFDEGILFLEGAKMFSSLQQLKTIKFTHPRFISYTHFALCDTLLDPVFFLKRGIYLKNNILYFSPYHTKHDFRRLYNALEEYFTQESNDNLDQK